MRSSRNPRHHEKTLGVERGGSWCGGEGRTDRREQLGKRHRKSTKRRGRPGETAAFCQRNCGRIISTRILKSAALFALVGTILLTVVLAVGLIRDISAFTSGAIAANAILVSLIHLLASLSVTVFLYLFHKAQS